MQVHINEVVSRVQAVDGEAVLSPGVLQKVVTAVMHAMDERQRRGQQATEDTKLDAHRGGAGET